MGWNRHKPPDIFDANKIAARFKAATDKSFGRDTVKFELHPNNPHSGFAVLKAKPSASPQYSLNFTEMGKENARLTMVFSGTDFTDDHYEKLREKFKKRNFEIKSEFIKGHMITLERAAVEQVVQDWHDVIMPARS